MYELEVEHGAAYDSIAILKSTCTLASGLICIDSRVSYRGGEGGLEFPPPPPPHPPEILKLSMVIIVVPSILAIQFYMLLDISMCHQNVVWKVCPRLRQKQSERI